MAIQDAILAQKSNRLEALTRRESLSAAKQFAASSLFAIFRQRRMAIKQQYAQLKQLSGSDRGKVYLLAMSSFQDRLRQSVAEITTLDTDPACEDSCNYSKDYEYQLADIEYWESVDDCDDEYFNCCTQCFPYPPGMPRTECYNLCREAFDDCIRSADAAWVAKQEGIRASIRDCILNNCHD